jgi:hypothetical protein
LQTVKECHKIAVELFNKQLYIPSGMGHLIAQLQFTLIASTALGLGMFGLWRSIAGFRSGKQ